jgi:hypothetical protein
VSLRRRAKDEVEQEGGPDPDAAWAEALERFSAMSVPERAAEVLATVAPAIAEYWDSADLKPIERLKGILKTTHQQKLLEHVLPEIRVPMESDRTRRKLGVLLTEAFNALVLARLLIPYDYWASGSGSQLVYFVGPVGVAALERGDVAEVVARRLPD